MASLAYFAFVKEDKILFWFYSWRGRVCPIVTFLIFWGEHHLIHEKPPTEPTQKPSQTLQRRVTKLNFLLSIANSNADDTDDTLYSLTQHWQILVTSCHWQPKVGCLGRSCQVASFASVWVFTFAMPSFFARALFAPALFCFSTHFCSCTLLPVQPLAACIPWWPPPPPTPTFYSLCTLLRPWHQPIIHWPRTFELLVL